jgi:hypothetical protein
MNDLRGRVPGRDVGELAHDVQVQSGDGSLLVAGAQDLEEVFVLAKRAIPVTRRQRVEITLG